MNRAATLSLAAASAVLAASAALLIAGPINPPAGPVGSTLKTLAEIEPRIPISLANTPGDADSLYRITQPGSYYLTGNIQGVAAKHGIEIAASGVTLDLNGFDLIGIPASLDGIVATAFVNNIEIRNGTVRQWGGDGIDLLSLTARGGLVTRIRASGNSGMGIGIGNRFTLTECEAGLNLGLGGILTGHGCTIARCTAFDNTADGMVTSSGCIVTECTFFQNGEEGLELGEGGNASGCTATGNGKDGVHTAPGCTVDGCVASENGEYGIDAGTGTTVTACAAKENGASGIFANGDNTVSGCTATGNAASGIFSQVGSTISGCTVSGNTGGIAVSSQCVVTSNICARNNPGGTGAGIVLGTDNRVEGNTCIENGRGIVAGPGSTGNIIVRNTCTANTTNWSVVAGNVILVVNATTAGAVNGNSGGSAPGSTDPNANFSY